MWDTSTPLVLLVGPDPVVALMAVSGHIYAAVGKHIAVIDPDTLDIERRLVVNTAEDNRVAKMAVAGVGLWVAMSGSSKILLYHTETLAFISDLDLTDKVKGHGCVEITALSAHSGLLWIGTNIGLAMSIPLPRLGGVPILTKGAVNISCHAHSGPVRMFLPINQSVLSEETPATNKKSYRLSTTSQDTIEEEPELRSLSLLREDKDSNGHLDLAKRYSSPRMAGRRNPIVRKLSDSTSSERRASKTLPRGFSLSQAAECGESIYGLYEDLLNVQDYDCESGELHRSRQNCHKSDPELNTIPYRVSTLDRRMTMKLQRPRSLDLSSWSVESSRSSHTTSSSGSDGSEKGTSSPSVSRNASFMSQKSVMSTNGPSVSRAQSVRKPVKPKSEIANRTVTTLMGGRGYRHGTSTAPTGHKTNYADAALVIWDQKV